MQIQFDTDGDSFEDWGEIRELERIFAEIVADRNRPHCPTRGVIMDVNGNRIGEWNGER